eukprot:1511638-Pyramimonas_sp.AAC.2
MGARGARTAVDEPWHRQRPGRRDVGLDAPDINRRAPVCRTPNGRAALKGISRADDLEWHLMCARALVVAETEGGPSRHVADGQPFDANPAVGPHWETYLGQMSLAAFYGCAP